MKIGVIGVPGGWSSERLADSVEKKTGSRILIDLENIYFDSSKQTVLYEDIDLKKLDALIVKKAGPRYSPELLNRLDCLLFLEKQGLPIFSKPSAIMNSFSRLSNTFILQNAKIPMPETTITENISTAVETVKRYKEAVFKPLFSTKARGMILVREDDDISALVTGFKSKGNTTMYVQKKIDIPGKDLGVAFLGGKYLATYARVAHEKSWNTTIHDGGRYEAYDADDEIIKLAHRAQQAFGLDFTGVDVVQTSQGLMVFEVSAFGGFRGLLEGNNIDAAELYTDYVIGKIK